MTDPKSGDREENSGFSSSMNKCENLPNNELDKLKQDHEVVIVMVPFPIQGHLNQLLQLACLISSSYHLPVYYVGSATHNQQAWVQANVLNPSDVAKIHFREKLMESEEGDAIRKRAKELGEAVRRSMEKGGSSRIELDSFIAHITR